MKQFSFSDFPPIRLSHGGKLAAGKRKTARPFSSKKPIHVVFRSSKAVGPMALNRNNNRQVVEDIITKQAKRWGIKIYRKSVNSNHCHLLLRAKYKWCFQNFLRAITGIIAAKITGAIRSKPFGTFWDELVWSRVSAWGKAFKKVASYVLRNELESEGLIPYRRKQASLPLLL